MRGELFDTEITTNEKGVWIEHALFVSSFFLVYINGFC